MKVSGYGNLFVALMIDEKLLLIWILGDRSSFTSRKNQIILAAKQRKVPGKTVINESMNSIAHHMFWFECEQEQHSLLTR